VSDLRIGIEELDGAGKALNAVGARYVTALAAFQAQLEGFGRPWGEDDIGMLIGAAHDEVSSFAFECYHAALTDIQDAGTDLSGMAAKYAVAEQAILKRLQALGGSA
jgi:hypothetical protein